MAPWKVRNASIIQRLTGWYILSLLTLVLIATSYLYWSFQKAIVRDNIAILDDRLATIASILNRPVDPIEAARRRIGSEWASRYYGQLYVRVRGTSANETLIKSPNVPAEVENAVFGRVGTRIPTESGKVFLSRELRLEDKARAFGGEVVQGALDITDQEQMLAAYRWRLAMVALIAAVLSIFVGRGIALRALRPLRTISEAMGRVRLTTLNERIPPEGFPRELQDLARTLNDMLGHLEEAFGRLTRFTSDIAHELRTPLGNLRGEIEVTLGRARTPEEYRETLSSSLEEVGKLSQMIDSLLFLAKTENPATHLSQERFNVLSEIQHLVEFYGASATEEEIEITLGVPRELEIHADRTLFQRSVANLLSNAINHTPRAGVIAIHGGTDHDGSLLLQISDSGPGIPATDIPHIFGRFYRVDRARSPNKLGGFGLGLAIVKNIMSLHGGDVRVESRPGKGACFTLVFPDRAGPRKGSEQFENQGG